MSFSEIQRMLSCPQAIILKVIYASLHRFSISLYDGWFSSLKNPVGKETENRRCSKTSEINWLGLTLNNLINFTKLYVTMFFFQVRVSQFPSTCWRRRLRSPLYTKPSRWQWTDSGCQDVSAHQRFWHDGLIQTVREKWLPSSSLSPSLSGQRQKEVKSGVFRSSSSSSASSGMSGGTFNQQFTYKKWTNPQF